MTLNQSLECLFLDVFVIELCSLNETLHYNISLFFHCKTLTSGWQDPIDGFHGDDSHLIVLLVDVKDCSMKHEPDLLWF